MGRGLSKAAKRAAAHVEKNPNSTAAEVAKKFGLDVTTVYRSGWWKERHNLKAMSKRVAIIAK